MTRRKNCFGKKQKELKSKRKKKYSDDSGFDVSLFDRRKKNGNIKFIFINFERYLILCTISFFFPFMFSTEMCWMCACVPYDDYYGWQSNALFPFRFNSAIALCLHISE